MSFPEALAPAVFSGQDLLALDEDQLVKILNDYRASCNDFDISRVVRVDGLSEGQQSELSEKLSAAAEKAGPFAGRDRTGDTPSGSQSRRVRSPTSSPTPEGNSRFEAFCHDELVKAGGRPIVSFELLLDPLNDAEASREMLRPWLGDTDLGSRDGDVPPAFSAQLEDWELFQHRWQWDNRGKYAGDEGFTAFLESQRKRHLHKGESEIVSDPSFEETAKQIWMYEERYLESSGMEGFAAYTQAVRKRLASHQFTQPLQLAEDPRQQDPWTTWVEYLSYIYWWQDRHAAAMRAAEPQYQQMWDELQRFDTSPSWTPSSTTGTLDEQLDAATAQLETTRQQVHKFIKDTETYRRCKMAVHRQELRARWVLEQLPLIDTVSSTEHKVTKSTWSANSHKKRKPRDDHDALPLQQLERKKQDVSDSGSTIVLNLGPATGSDITTPGGTAATSATTRSKVHRSRHHRADVTAGESSSSQPRSEARRIRKTSRQRRA